MRRLRITATAVSILTAEFGPRARERRINVRKQRGTAGLMDLAPIAFIGPEALPAEMFTEDTLDRLRAL